MLIIQAAIVAVPAVVNGIKSILSLFGGSAGGSGLDNIPIQGGPRAGNVRIAFDVMKRHAPSDWQAYVAVFNAAYGFNPGTSAGSIADTTIKSMSGGAELARVFTLLIDKYGATCDGDAYCKGWSAAPLQVNTSGTGWQPAPLIPSTSGVNYGTYGTTGTLGAGIVPGGQLGGLPVWMWFVFAIAAVALFKRKG